MKKNIQLLIVGLIVNSFIILSCSDNSDNKTSADDYEKGKISLLKQEEKHPEKFLTVSNSYKKNLLGQSVIKGKIKNNAKVVNYKDIALKLSFYSKTGALLEEDIETIFEQINAGNEQTFKSKYFTPKGTDSVSILVETAIVVK